MRFSHQSPQTCKIASVPMHMADIVLITQQKIVICEKFSDNMIDLDILRYSNMVYIDTYIKSSLHPES
jgi:hypothetical protein